MAAKRSWFARLFGGGPGGPAEAAWDDGQLILDDFVVEGQLGQGGMGAVYLLRSRSTGGRFAVKRALLRDADARRNFLAELQAWIDLPEHPHVTACRFFRTVGDEIAVFAEYVDGGSLEAAIRGRKLTRLEQILDVAIQFAWGLHAVHEHGLIHQDVKPGNVLLTGDGVVKVADFGLARARAAAGASGGAAGQSILVSCGGMTPAYCSPEQAAGKPLSRRTDVWSWGVSVLEMFTGGVTWPKGTVAAAALEEYLASRPAGPGPAMPPGVADVLCRCFRKDPPQRWAGLAEAADALRAVYRQAVERDHPRKRPAGPRRARVPLVAPDRWTGSTWWTDPREWLTKALRAAGRDASGVEALLPPRGGSRKAEAIGDLAAYEEACRLYEELVASGRKDLEPQLATLCIEKALIHRSVDDHPGAIASYDRAIALCQRLVEQGGPPELAHELARACMNKAVVVSDLGDNGAAVALYDRAIALYQRLVDQEGGRELDTDLALARAYVNKAASLEKLGDNRAAVPLYDRAIGFYEWLVEQERRPEHGDDLARACMNKANALWALGDNGALVPLYDRAIALYERLVEQEGRRELADGLARACMNKANALWGQRDSRAAVPLYDRAIAGYERVVEQDGRRESANELAAACVNKAVMMRALGDNRAAVVLFDRAIAIRERLVEQEGRQELRGDLARALAVRAACLLKLGNSQKASADARNAVAILQTEVVRTGQADLRRVLDWATTNLKDLL